MSGFGHMSGLDKGVEHYADRAMVLPAEVVYVKKDGSGLGLVDEHLAFLKRPDVALGPNKIIQVDGQDLFSGIMSDPFVREDFQKSTMRGSRVQIFCMTPRAESFFMEMMIDARQIDSAPLEIASKLNDKIELRRIGASMGLSHAFLDHVVADDPTTAVLAVKTFLARPPEDVPFVVVKQADLAGGEGFLKIMRGDDLDRIMHPYFGRFVGKRALIEEGHPHKAISIQIAVEHSTRYVGRILGWTRQLVHADTGRHFGNSMVRMSPGQEHPLIAAEQRRNMETWADTFARFAHERIVGYHGTIGFDLIRLNRPKRDPGLPKVGRDLFMLECNARQTASTYPLAVSHQLESGKRGAETWAITMWNAVPTSARSYGEILSRLGDGLGDAEDNLVFRHARGIIPFNPRLLTLDEPSIGIIAVGRDLVDAGRMGREAKRRLSA